MPPQCPTLLHVSLTRSQMTLCFLDCTGGPINQLTLTRDRSDYTYYRTEMTDLPAGTYNLSIGTSQVSRLFGSLFSVCSEVCEFVGSFVIE